jgi:hypothetical protein
MNNDGFSFVTYSQNHREIVESGSEAVKKRLTEADYDEKRSLLFCLDRYLDPYYGYNLPFFDEIILLLQEQLFAEEDEDVIADILQLLTDYSKEQLDYLADHIEELHQHYLANALNAIGNTYNEKYVPLLIKYGFHAKLNVQEAAQDALKELSGKSD